MRILQVCVRYPPALGGVETHVQRLSEGLAERGHDVVVATSTLRSEFPFEELSAAERAADARGPVQVQRFPATTLPGDAHWPYLRGLGAWMRREASSFDVLHAHSYGFHHTLETLLAAKLAAEPMVLTPHFHPHWSMELGARRRFLRAAFDAAAKGALLDGPDAVVCVSEAEASLLRAPPGKVRVIPNGVDPRAWEGHDGASFRARHGLQGPVGLFVGRLAANKGLLTLLDAWRAMPAEATLLVVGEGHLRGVLEARARALGLAGRVRLLGALPLAELQQAYAACDVFVLPSEYEAFGIVLLEAMAAGKPCVAARAGGMPEVVEHERTGLLVPYGDAAALAEALRQVLRDPKLAAALGQAGRRRVHERFTWDAIVRRTEALYGTLR